MIPSESSDWKTPAAQFFICKIFQSRFGGSFQAAVFCGLVCYSFGFVR